MDRVSNYFDDVYASNDADDLTSHIVDHLFGAVSRSCPSEDQQTHTINATVSMIADVAKDGDELV